LASVAAKAQEEGTPKVDVFAGYQWLHPGATVPAPFQPPNAPVAQKMGDIPQGAGAAVTYNFTPHWGLEADYGGNFNKFGSEQTASIGPRFAWRSEGVMVFAHTLLGYNRLNVPLVDTSNGLGAILGGGGPVPTLVRVAPPAETPLDRAFAKALEETRMKVATLTPAEAEEKWRKGETVRDEGLLEFYPPDDNSFELGGFSHLKDWLERERVGFSSEARALDLPTPRGILIVGVQGCGKSLAAKAIARAWQQPLLKLDAGNNIVEVDRFFINFSKVFIEGVDLEASYRKSVELLGGGPEQVVARFYATDLIKNASLTQFGSYDEWAGQVGTARSLPKHKYTANLNYSNGPYSLFMQGRYISKGKLDHTLAESPVPVVGMQSINDNTIGSIFYLDMNVGYTVPVAGDLRIYGQVQNVLDRSPPTVAAAYGRTGSNSNNPQLYDVLGRRYFLGMNYKF